MQNKGAIRLFAILLALACAYYLMFTWVAGGIGKDADAFALNYVSQPEVVEAAKASGSERTYIDSVENMKRNAYLDSLNKKTVIDLGIAQYTYDDVKKRQLNLGLDLKGGMNVTLEVSIGEIIKGLSNNSNDPSFVAALAKAQEIQRTSTKDFVTIFGEEYNRINPNGKLATNFQTIELKGKIDFNTSNEEVLKFLRERIEDAIATSENTLRARIDKFGVTQPNIQRLSSSGRILIELPGITDKRRVEKLLQGTANLEFWETFDNEEIYPLLEKANTRLKEILTPVDSSKLASNDTSKITPLVVDDKVAKPDTIKSGADSAKSLASQLGKDETDSVKGGETRADTIARLRKENPLFAVLNAAINRDEKGQPVLGRGPVVGYAAIPDTAKVNTYLNNPKVKALFKKGTRFAWTFKAIDKEETTVQLIAIRTSNREGKAPLSGDIIVDARKVFDQAGGGSPQISMSMTAEAGQEWKRLTAANIGKSIAIVLDNSVYSFPTVQNEISGGVSSITGQFTNEEADDLVNILKAGKLPAPAHIVQETVVGPVLGAEAVSKGLLSTVIALLLVLVFMGLYYSKAGWVADLAMIINNFFVVGILASFQAVLTLPGIAGIVLTIAMSVDANILIFERVREELALGKSTAQAIKEGYKNAMSSVIDSHVTGLLLGIILYVFGTGPIQGFATTLIIGIISSLFCAIFITRLVFDRWLNKNKAISFSIPATANAFKKINIDFVGKRKFYYLFSALVIAAGIFCYVQKGGFRLGVDFKGGRSYVVRFDDLKTTEEVNKALTASFGEAPEVKTYGSSTQLRITTTYLIEDASADAEANVEGKLNEGLKTLGTKYQIMSSDKVGETMSRDIKAKAIWAVLLSCLVMFVFIFVRFKKWQYGLGAVVALFHDVAMVLSFYLIFDGILPFSLEITQDFIAAILTVMSYSMTDTVVVFDRIREYLTERNKTDLDKNERVRVINFALNSTLSRTINTSLTIFFVLLAIFIFGGVTIKGFSFALLIGIVIGTYSSICIATPIVIDLEKEKADKVPAPVKA
ncbi:MAG: preprotein translocase subunit SecD [Bacteroidota bacterium]|jgi:SecD/SecF fusion protein|nr:preprotein translocase subunit SecD [Bacteroidota bacterium]